MKRFFSTLAVAVLAAVTMFAAAQTPPPSAFANSAPVLAATTVTGAGATVNGLNVDKTYEVLGTVASGTGSAVVTVEGSNGASSWSTLGTVTLSLTASPSSGSFFSFDRYKWLRGNAKTLTGTTATVSITMGY